MGAWVAWVKLLNFYVGCVGCVGRTIFYMGQHFTWIITFALVVWVNIFHVVQTFLRTFNFSAGVIFLNFFFFGGGGEKGVLGSLSHNNFFSPKICNLTLPLQLCTKEYSLPRKFCQKYFKRKQTMSQNI